LRRMRARGTRSNGYGNSIFSLICKLLVLRYLENEHVCENPNGMRYVEA
jgi:hypothetical protein